MGEKVTRVTNAPEKLQKGAVLAQNRDESHPIRVGNGVFRGVCVPVGEARSSLHFHHGKGRFPCADEISFAVHQRDDKTKIARGQLFGGAERQRSGFERVVVVEFRFRFAQSGALVEREKRKPGENTHWHFRYRLQKEVRRE